MGETKEEIEQAITVQEGEIENLLRGIQAAESMQRLNDMKNIFGQPMAFDSKEFYTNDSNEKIALHEENISALRTELEGLI